ncbi:MAG: M15 family metallopeptidase [Bacteroidota bacterium]
MKTIHNIKSILFFFLLGAFLHDTSPAQVITTYPYGLIPLDTNAYKLRNDSTGKNTYLIPVCGIRDNIRCDLKYATKDNFTGIELYSIGVAYLAKEVAQALSEAAEELEKAGYGLVIWDAYRPYSVTIRFWELIGNEDYVAHPSKGSRHNRGCAVDVALYDIKSKQVVDLPTTFDHFGPEAAANALCSSELKCNNRDVLISTMQRHGFNVLASEWWHFDFTGWEDFPVMDVPLEWLVHQ